MTNTFELKKGKLVFDEDKMIITDSAKQLKITRLISASFLLVLAVARLFSYLKTGGMPSLRFVLIFGTLGILFIVVELMKSTQSEIFLKDVKSMKVKRTLFSKFLSIKLSNNKTRQVVGFYNAERLEEYIKTISLPQ